MKLVCEHCQHQWNYTGSKNKGQYITCPKCYYKVRITEDKITK